MSLESKPGCQLCDYRNGNLDVYFQRLGLPGDLSKNIILQTPHFVVKPDSFPVHPYGRHVLIHPKGHGTNFASFGENADEVGRAVYAIERIWGEKVVIFEHGGSPTGVESSVQSIYHAHVHVVGGLEDVDIIQYMSDMLNGGLEQEGTVYEHSLSGAPSHAFVENLQYHYGEVPYLYIQQGGRAIYAPDPNNDMRSQITQRSMHDWFSGTRELNWKQFGDNEEFVALAANRVLRLLDHCKDRSAY